ncbi:MAG TPA: zinc-dependent alcohol dehydrogenase family protein [Candidatus Eremiobacteraceae bacterium]|nr:zinc-dependent alcohol dehydrogenase family protein [Candidatus Eremiobacteraceae bacterium]
MFYASTESAYGGGGAGASESEPLMHAMLLDAPRRPLRAAEVADTAPPPGHVRIRVLACGVCRTDLHIYDGELTHPKLPLVLGHEIIGTVEVGGPGAQRFRAGDRVGVPWLAGTDGTCRYCRDGRENLCEHARFTGYDVDGGYAQATIADEAFCFAIPAAYGDDEAAPLMCAGLIGYRSLRMAGDAERVGIYGFGAAAHIIAQIARHEGRRVFAFTRPGDAAAQSFARELGAVWAGGSDAVPPEQLDAAIIFAPAGELVPTALRALGRGGIVVCGGIHMSAIPSFDYALLWEERQIRSVANLTRRDAQEFLALAPQVPVRTWVTRYPLERANDALADLRGGKLRGAAVLIPSLDRSGTSDPSR